MNFDYTRRDYLGLRDQITAYVQTVVPDWSPDPSDFGLALVEAMAYMGDLLSYYVDLAAQESNILTANSAANVYAQAELLGYTPGMALSARVPLSVTNTTIDGQGNQADVTIAAGTQAYDPSTGLKFEIVDAVVVAHGTTKTDILAYEGTTDITQLGMSDGFPNQRYPIPLDLGTYLDGRPGMLHVEIGNPSDPFGGESWDVTYGLPDKGPRDRAFTIVTDDAGNSTLVFGDGINGAIPAAGAVIMIKYRKCSGAAGNATTFGGIRQWLGSGDYLGGPMLPKVSVTNTAAASGGTDVEDVASVRTNAVKVSKAQRRAVTRADYGRVLRESGDVLASWADAKVWSRPEVWFLPRDKTLLASGNDALLKKLSDSLQQEIEEYAVLGTSPRLSVGRVVSLSVSVEVRLWDTVDLRSAAAAVRAAILDAYRYENANFEDGVSEDSVLRAIAASVPPSVARFVKILSIDGPADGCRDIETYTGLGSEFTTTRVIGKRPNQGCALVIPDANLTITLVGGGKSLVDTGTN